MKINNPAKREVSIDDMTYTSLTEAAKKLNITLATVKGRCNSKHWPMWYRNKK